MRKIEKPKSVMIKRLKLYLALLVSFCFVDSPLLAQTPQKDQVVIKGIVKDEQGETIIGATVRPQSNTFAGVATGLDGSFTIYVSSMNDVLIFNYVGMEELQVPLKSGVDFYNVVLKVSQSTQIKDIVVEAGIIQHNKLTFTGAYTTVTADELKSIGHVNILQNLAAFDPGFNIVDNMSMGSNPNAMANIQIRGQNTLDINSVQDDAAVSPNLPLFVLDGFESTLEEINDLNINMVESITILKDAGSTAIYGAKGGNGVIIIETKKPEYGKIMVRYDGQIQLATPDLSVYNMMNSAEKLEFERLAGRYGVISDTENMIGDQTSLYYQRLAKVRSGVDTYWLSEPVRTGITHSHSVNITGGESRGLSFLAGINYKKIEGVIKDSGRETYTGSIKLTYRGLEGFNIQNNLSVQGTNARDGSWGNFQNFVNANPYYTKYDEDGSIPKVLEEYTLKYTAGTPTFYTYNPLYNATLNTKNDASTTIIRNNTAVDWYVTDELRIKGGFSLEKQIHSQENFIDPRDTRYVNVDYTKQGEYSSVHSQNWKYSGNLNLIYTKQIQKHQVTFNGRTALEESNSNLETMKAVGFPAGVGAIPSYAYSYEDGRPNYNKIKTRQVTFLAALNYDYDFRYLLNASVNREGTTSFGNKNKFETFWSVGAGWNLHKEHFVENWDWLDFLKLRATYGTNAIQTFSGVTTASVFKSHNGYNVFGIGYFLESFGNPYFQWQKVGKKTGGIEATFLNNKLGFQFDIYGSDTDPQAINLPQKSSSGMKTYPVNMGYVKAKGYEFGVTISPIRNTKERIFLTLAINGTHVKNTYGGFADSFKQLNDELMKLEDNPMANLVRFEDGYSPDDLWAVPSLGIDPMTGKEVFLKKNGQKTYVYDSDDRIRIANSAPDLRGYMRLNFIYKKLQLNMAFKYSIGGYRFNDALYTKVENISSEQIMNNQDKRALYDRWKNPGDISQFKAIKIGESTPMSSRFIQKENYLQGESIQLSWDFSNDAWIKKIYMKELRVSFTMNDLFTASTIKVERGTAYPFQRSFSLNVSTRF